MNLCELRGEVPKFGDADQAEGLRRLFARRGARVLPIVAPDGKQGALVANLAMALARGGREVLVVDATRGEVHQAIGLRARYELAHVVCGDKGLTDIVLAPCDGLRIVPAARALEGAGNLDQWLAALAGEMNPQPDLIILHQATAPTALEGDVLIAATPMAQAVTRTYAELKRMQGHKGRLHFVLSGAAEDSARNLHRTMNETTQRFLGASVDWAGFVPQDAQWKRAEAAARSILDFDMHAASARALMNLAAALDEWELPRVLPSRTAH